MKIKYVDTIAVLEREPLTHNTSTDVVSSETLIKSSGNNTDELLHTFLSCRDVPCPMCKYNLRTLTGNQCPECGTHLQLQVGIIEMPWAAWIVQLISLCLGAGGFTLLAAFMTLQGQWDKLLEEKIIGFSIGLMALCIPAAIVTIARRRNFQRLSIAYRWIFSAIATLLGFTGLLIFGFFVN